MSRLAIVAWIMVPGTVQICMAAESLRGVAARGLVRQEFIDSLLTRRLKEHAGYYGEMVWILMMLEQWLRRHAPNWQMR